MKIGLFYYFRLTKDGKENERSGSNKAILRR